MTQSCMFVQAVQRPTAFKQSTMIRTSSRISQIETEVFLLFSLPNYSILRYQLKLSYWNKKKPTTSKYSYRCKNQTKLKSVPIRVVIEMSYILILAGQLCLVQLNTKVLNISVTLLLGYCCLYGLPLSFPSGSSFRSQDSYIFPVLKFPHDILNQDFFFHIPTTTLKQPVEILIKGTRNMAMFSQNV